MDWATLQPLLMDTPSNYEYSSNEASGYTAKPSTGYDLQDMGDGTYALLDVGAGAPPSGLPANVRYLGPAETRALLARSEAESESGLSNKIGTFLTNAMPALLSLYAGGAIGSAAAGGGGEGVTMSSAEGAAPTQVAGTQYGTMPPAVAETPAQLAAQGLENTGPGMWEQAYPAGFPATGTTYPTSTLMPPAQAETPAALAEQGLTETSPGVFEQTYPAGFPATGTTYPAASMPGGGSSPSLKDASSIAAGIAGLLGAGGAGTDSGIDPGTGLPMPPPSTAPVDDAAARDAARAAAEAEAARKAAEAEAARVAAEAERQRVAEAARQARIAANRGKVDSAFAGFDDGYYKSIADAFKGYMTPEVDRTFSDAEKRVIYRAPGGVGSTAFAENLGRVQGDRARAMTLVGEEGASEAHRAKQSVESQRAALLGQAESAEDTSIFGEQATSAAKSLQGPQNANPGAYSPTSYAPAASGYSPLADLFQRYSSLAANANIAENAGYEKAQIAPRALNFGGGGSRSVSTVGGWRG